jgi:O-antigen ligase
MLDLDLQVRGASATSWAMCGTFVVAIALMTLSRHIPVVRRRRRPELVVATVIMGVLTVVFVLAVTVNERVSRALGRAPGFSDRLPIWEAAGNGFLDRPAIGWGWLAAWRSDEFLSSIPVALPSYYGSHSSYLDIALSGGVVAIVIATAMAWFGFRSVVGMAAAPDVMSAVPFALFASIAVGWTQESFFVGNYFLTAFLVAAMSGHMWLTPHDPGRVRGGAPQLEDRALDAPRRGRPLTPWVRSG